MSSGWEQENVEWEVCVRLSSCRQLVRRPSLVMSEAEAGEM